MIVDKIALSSRGKNPVINPIRVNQIKIMMCRDSNDKIMFGKTLTED